eukprot:CAMPEP_0171997112 /NCGR_PEP_ID=MMETSP1041-20130122/508_1 /TAXON_ID=464988 /ORGANISM="Hemiselmis andersenii, Strain CCMP439" /LENGTH=93 /DNA_ID=CAMNT_0012650355 /DNA_START=144 /DNA_END=421 /DNA_ORIENTATION=-
MPTTEQAFTQAEAIAELTKRLDQAEGNVDMAWVVLCGALVFFMQAGFGMLEAGAVSRKNVINILFKNMLHGSCAAMAFWLLGYGFAFGDTAGG